MTEAVLQHMHQDLEELKRDVALIKNILVEEGKLTDYARELLEEARNTPKSQFISHDELKKRIFS